MKTRIKTILLAGIFFAGYAHAQSCCEDKNDHSNCKMDHADHKIEHGNHKMIQQGEVMGMSLMGSAENYDVVSEFREQVQAIYQSTLDLNNAFVESDANMVNANVKIVGDLIKAVDMNLLKGEAHMTWMKHSHVLAISLASIASSDNLEKQRASYATFNQALYAAIKTFGTDERVYVQHCPMANANWLSSKEAITNPYYGHKMLTCGSNAEIIN